MEHQELVNASGSATQSSERQTSHSRHPMLREKDRPHLGLKEVPSDGGHTLGLMAQGPRLKSGPGLPRQVPLQLLVLPSIPTHVEVCCQEKPLGLLQDSEDRNATGRIRHHELEAAAHPCGCLLLL